MHRSAALYWAAGVLLSGALAVPAIAGDKIRPLELIAPLAEEDASGNRAAYMIADMWRSLGLDIDVAEMPHKKRLDVVYWERDACNGAACFDMSLWSLFGRPERSDPDEAIYALLHSKEAAKGYNFPGYLHPEYDRLATAQRAETVPEKRQLLIRKAQALHDQDPAYFFLVNPQLSVALRSDVWDPATVVEQAGLGYANFWTYLAITPRANDDTLRLDVGGDLNNLGPLSVGGGAALIQEMVWDRLLRLGPDGLPQPWAAESYRWIDETTLELTLRPGMTWHDGIPVTADDVVFTLAEIGDLAPLHAPLLRIIEHVEAVDPRTVRISLKRPYAPFPAVALAQISLTPAHIWRPIMADLRQQGLTVDDYQPTQWIGSGPFRFDGWVDDKAVRLVANPAHWSPPKVVQSIIRVVRDPGEAVGKLSRGELNFLRDFGGDSAQLDELAAADIDIAVLSGVGLGVEYGGFNLKRAPFHDAAFRRALSAAIDRDALALKAWRGRAVKTNSMISTALGYWHNTALDVGSASVEQARQMLADAGYDWVEGKLHYPDGIGEDPPRPN